MYVYIRSEPGLWTVGFYRPDGTWEAESDHDSRDNAAARVAHLNGGSRPSAGDLLVTAVVPLLNAAPDMLAGLKIAVETIRVWHGFGHTTDEAEMWTLYQKSPEMQLINAAIAKAEGAS